ncbi:MAG: GreA/GreB family elongation factor [Firmicutes bacterium]|nr:GreA/GreB family elongation factor [Bacillota bacterium]
MNDELTQKDIDKINEEIEYRKSVKRHELLEEVKRTRAFGDLSENFEYKEAKRMKNQNESRIRYLTNVVKTAKIVTDTSDYDTVGFFDKVECKMVEFDRVQTIQIVTTIRTDALKGRFGKDSPFGKAILGKRVGDKCRVNAPNGSYTVEILSIEKGSDDGSVPIMQY